MEFLPAQKISPQQRETEQLYVELARVLQKMHRGSNFPTNLDVFGRINKDVAKVKAAAKTGVPLDKLQKVLEEIQQACAFQEETAPCHNDNPANPARARARSRVMGLCVP